MPFCANKRFSGTHRVHTTGAQLFLCSGCSQGSLLPTQETKLNIAETCFGPCVTDCVDAFENKKQRRR